MTTPTILTDVSSLRTSSSMTLPLRRSMLLLLVPPLLPRRLLGNFHIPSFIFASHVHIFCAVTRPIHVVRLLVTTRVFQADIGLCSGRHRHSSCRCCDNNSSVCPSNPFNIPWLTPINTVPSLPLQLQLQLLLLRLLLPQAQTCRPSLELVSDKIHLNSANIASDDSVLSWRHRCPLRSSRWSWFPRYRQ